MENSPLYRLPAEIRVMIYEYTLIRDQSLELLPASGSAAACQLTSPYCNVINISGTCRQIREESIAIFYKGNTFDIDLGTHLQAREDFDDRIWKVCTWLQDIGYDSARHFRKIRIKMDVAEYDELSDADLSSLNRLAVFLKRIGADATLSLDLSSTDPWESAEDLVRGVTYAFSITDTEGRRLQALKEGSRYPLSVVNHQNLARTARDLSFQCGEAKMTADEFFARFERGLLDSHQPLFEEETEVP